MNFFAATIELINLQVREEVNAKELDDTSISA